VGGTPESVVRAAKFNLPVIFAIIGGNPAQFKPLFDYYRKALQHFGHSTETLQVGVHIHAFFGENGRQTADDYYPTYAGQMNRIGRQRGCRHIQSNSLNRAVHHKVTLSLATLMKLLIKYFTCMTCLVLPVSPHTWM
jgi:alkanesulfonate monooxygenase SsuD/methylene tetrahydromethanopterin reductase-like flavin-dependent oxidoreductase (luciferase family)